ncbi:MAG: CHAD domain-containing protein [Aquisalinus sp.]|nr:CHAD domain-containing protein [Aquisalinus sp.]
MHDRTAPYSRILKSVDSRLELRFLLNSDTADQLRGTELFGNEPTVLRPKKRIRQSFFDTPQRHMQNAGVELRSVQGSGRIKQITRRRAVKGQASNFSFDIETELSGEAGPYQPTITRFHAPTDALICAHQADLVPLVSLELLQELSSQTHNGAEIGLSLERCQVEADSHDASQLQQLVLIHAAGDVKEFYGFARGISRRFRLRLASQSPLAIARRLLSGKQEAGIKAGKFVLAENATALDVARLAFDQAVSQIIANRTAAADGDVDAIKQLRVGLRRFRSLERLFRKALQHPALHQLVPVAKEYGKTLGYARDWDVFSEQTVAKILAASTLDGADRTILIALKEGAESHRLSAKQHLRTALNAEEFTDFCLRLKELTDITNWSAAGRHRLEIPAAEYAERALGKRLRKVHAMAEDLASAPAHARHPLRVELKKLRYAVQAFRPLYAKEVRKPYLASLSELQDAFGVLNDAVVAREMALAAARPTFQDRQLDIHRAMGASFAIGWSAQQLQGQTETVYQAWLSFAAMQPFWLGARAHPEI